MLALDTAISAAFTGNSTLTTAFPGGIHGDRAPEGTTATPYVIYTVLSGQSVKSYGGAEWSDVVVRFQAIGNGKNATGATAQLIANAYDDTILALSGTSQNYDCRRISRPIPSLWSLPDGTGNELWSWTLTYLFSIRN